MDLASLKNLDVKDILGKIKGGGLADILKNKKLLIKFGTAGGFILILFCCRTASRLGSKLIFLTAVTNL